MLMAERLQAKPSAAAMMILFCMWFLKIVLIIQCHVDL